MGPKAKFVDLKLSGRKLLSPPEGYTPRSEARIKRWLQGLPSQPTADAPHDFPEDGGNWSKATGVQVCAHACLHLLNVCSSCLLGSNFSACCLPSYGKTAI